MATCAVTLVVLTVALVAAGLATAQQQERQVTVPQALTATSEELTRLATRVQSIRDVVAQYEAALAGQQQMMADAVAALDAGDDEALRAAVEAMRPPEE